MSTNQQAERHNSYGWIKPDAEACHVCHKKEYATPVDGFVVKVCDLCDRMLCENHADTDTDCDQDGYFQTSWICDGDARIECQQIADAILWAAQGYARSEHDSCQRCSKKQGEASPGCPNEREHATVFDEAAGEICNKLADELEAIDRAHGLPAKDYSFLRGKKVTA